MSITSDGAWRERSIDQSGAFEGQPKGLRAYCLAFDLQLQDLIDKNILDLGSNKYAMLAYEVEEQIPTARVVSLSPDFTFRDIRASVKKTFAHVKGIAALGQLLPFVENGFDYILSLHMLEHIPIDRFPLIVLEAGRILKHGGVSMFGPWNPYDGDIFGLLTQDLELKKKLESNKLSLEYQTVSSEYGEAKAFDPQTGMGLGYYVPYKRIVVKKG